jgi:hypothetical protein
VDTDPTDTTIDTPVDTDPEPTQDSRLAFFDTFVPLDTRQFDTYDTDFNCDAFDTYTQWELGCLGE